MKKFFAAALALVAFHALIAQNDLDLVGLYTSDISQPETFTPIEYTFLPLGQAAPIIISAVISNMGTAAQTNVIATVHLTMNGMPVSGSFSSNPLSNLAPGVSDTVVVATGWMPTEAGSLAVDVDISASEADDDPSNNSGQAEMRITAATTADLYSVWGVDDNNAQLFNTLGPSGKIGNLLLVSDPGSIAYGVHVGFGSVDPGDTVRAELYSLNGNSFDLLASSGNFSVEPWMENEVGDSLTTYIPFLEPFDLSPGSYVIAAISLVSGTGFHFAASGSSFPQSSFLQSDGTWYYVMFTPMIRLGLTAAPPSSQGPVANDDCTGAVMLMSASDSIGTNGSTLTAGADTISGPCGDENVGSDVWYSFTAEDTAQTILVQGYNGFDAVIELFGGSCGALVPLACGDHTSTQDLTASVADSLVYDPLVVGETYYVRIYDHDTGSVVPTFTTWLKSLTIDPSAGIEEIDLQKGVGLGQNFPNPGTAVTTIPYALTARAKVTLDIYNVAGTLLKTISEGNKPAGTYHVDVDTQDMQQGIYFYTLTTGDARMTKRMIVVH